MPVPGPVTECRVVCLTGFMGSGKSTVGRMLAAQLAWRFADLDAEIRKIVGAQGPDKVIETTGAKAVIELAYNLTHADGTCVLVGVPNEKVTIYTLPIHFNKILTGSHGGDAVPQVDIPRLIRLNKAGRLSLDGLITHEFPLDQINEALDVVRSGAAGRVLHAPGRL